MNRGWIKLEIPCSVISKMKSIVTFQAGKMEPALQNYNMKIISRSSIRLVEEQDCDPYYELNFEVGKLETFDENLLLAIRKYLECQAGFLPYQRGNLVLHSTDFWSSRLTCHQPEIPLCAIYWGNIQGGTFISHWEVSYWDDIMRRLKQSKNQPIKAADRNGINQIFAEFEFDKTDMMTINIKQFEMMANSNQTTRQEVLCFYQITLRRNQIRRIIVDPNVSDMYGENRCRIHFELNAPVLIRRGFFNKDQQASKNHQLPVFQRRLSINRGRTSKEYPTYSAISDSPIFTIDFDMSVREEMIYTILSRLRLRTGVSIEFATIPSIDCFIWKENPYHRWTFQKDGTQLFPTDFEAPVYRDFIAAAFPTQNQDGGHREIDISRERKFSITYLIECLLSRGAIVKDQILLDEKIWHRFLEIVLHYYSKDDKLCEAGLEDLVHMIDGKKRIGSILKCFDQICQTREKKMLANGLSKEEMREGYQRVRKLIFTPTRVIYVAPETLMGNRVLRKYDHDGTRILRIVFRDDDNQKMRANKTSSIILEKTVDKYLKDGIKVAGRWFGYLGSSNSQMRDSGAYFMEKYSSTHLRDYLRKCNCNPPLDYIPKIHDARKNLGKFEKIDNIPKMMARLGQCFTQSRLSGVDLEHHTYFTTFDLIGAKNSNGAEYTFSDGIGLMSRFFGEKISQIFEFGKGVPSCFQFRFRGMKGVIAIEPLLDDIRRWAQVSNISSNSETTWNINCVFRPSQIKFIAKRYPKNQVEIVKYSSPVGVALNKPFINILDQVSEMQSLNCHRRITNRIEELLDRQIYSFSQQIIDETNCRNRLKELPRRINIDFLKQSWGFTLSKEPFFRSLIKASIKFSITRQLRKEQIPIPYELGRSMLGVIDETGQLQYGQIFVQYTKNISMKHPSEMSAKEIIQGKVLLTKNPCIVSGDVRIFEAVDIPELHHMIDVVVFPQNGPRPHPDEMAGSDLDGDEYSIIWDQQMLLDYNEKPFDFSVEKKEKIAFEESEIDRLMREFYIKYLELDSVGTISNNHLHCSDQYGLNSKVCMDLAKKNCQAVDFTKSGQAPEPLRLTWLEVPETGEWIPPERAERVPDYHMSNDHSPVYISPRLCGKLFREFKSIDDVLKISEERDEQLEIPIDESINISGYETFLEEAKESVGRYNAELRSIMENYGIRNEGEIISGCIVEMRNRISDKDQDDMSFYNTNQMIETKITNLFKKYREEFFEEFDGGWRKQTELMEKCWDEMNIIQRVCRDPSIQMVRKAVAWYKACYEEAIKTRENKKLSFAWTVYDLIGICKRNAVLTDENPEMGGENPLYKILLNHRNQYIKDNQKKFEDFRNYDFLQNIRGKSKQIAGNIIKSYFELYSGFDEIVFILCEWAEKLMKNENSLKMHHFILLIILFATDQILTTRNSEVFIEKIDEKSIEEEMTEDEKSRLVIKFFEFLASRRFRKMENLSFKSINFESIFMRGEWLIFHVAALKTYYNMLFNLRFEELPISTDPEITIRTIIRENEPFIIELPANCELKEVLQKLQEFSGVEEINLRPMEKSKSKNTEKKENIRLIVSTRGTLESMYKLRQLVAVKVPIKTYVTLKEISSQLARLCYEKIMSGIF